MKKYLLLIIFLLFSVIGFSQISHQNFDTQTSWGYTENPSDYDISSDTWTIVSTMSSLTPTSGTKFWGMRDLNNPNGGGNFYHTLTFDNVDISSYSSVSISFDYEVIGYEIGSDYLRYEVFEDGVGQGQVFFLTNSSENGTKTIPITAGTNNAYIILADDSWNGSGQQCVYNGTGTSVTVTGLDDDTEYFFAVYSYGCSGVNQTYNMNESTGTDTTLLSTDYVQIESIMVDACYPGGGNEGENEMFRFRIDSVDMCTDDLVVDFPNNPWLGLETNTSITTPIVDSINAHIINGGLFIEPTSCVLEAGYDVLFITSTDFAWDEFDWAGVSDTLYILFQVAGNTAGHFANNDVDGDFRTLSVCFTGYDCDNFYY